ncbi:hypothetical protein FA346_13095 [Pseudomonas aeruginosa]|nr:hypothetical protein [Pseudomonas aeruginosa]
MSKELNKAPAEQAGGDERAAFFKHLIGRHPANETEIVRVLEHNYSAWKAWQARAALAQPSPTIATAPTYQFHSREIGESDWAPCDFSWYLYCSKSPEMDTRVVEVTAQPSPKSGYYSDQEWINAGCPPEQPSPVQAEQAEAERPEVVARVVHSTPVVLDQCAPLNANDEMMTVAQHAASVARWAEMFNRVEQERDAALARVAELDKQCRDDVARALGLRPSQERGFAWSYLLASIKSCVKASEDAAQAQHCVPIAPEFKRALGLVVATLEADGDRPTSKYALSELKKVLAAAPGKEGL